MLPWFPEHRRVPSRFLPIFRPHCPPRPEKEYNDKFSNPYNAARYGYIDDVIEPRNTRFRIIRALQSLATKRLQNPAKKHSNIPL